MNSCFLFIQLMIGFIIASLLILAYAAEQKQAGTYEDIVELVCGPFVKILAEVCVMVFCFGSVTAFLVVIGDQTVDSEYTPARCSTSIW